VPQRDRNKAISESERNPEEGKRSIAADHEEGGKTMGIWSLFETPEGKSTEKKENKNSTRRIN